MTVDFLINVAVMNLHEQFYAVFPCLKSPGEPYSPPFATNAKGGAPESILNLHPSLILSCSTYLELEREPQTHLYIARAGFFS